MMDCDGLALRLYDEDSRAALSGHREVPADVSVHLTQCARCGTLWTESGDELRRLTASLFAESPLAMRGALYAARRPSSTFGAGVWVDRVSQVLVGAALGASLLPASPFALPEVPGFCTGAAIAAAVQALRRAGVGSTQLTWPWRHVRARWLPQVLRIGG